MGIEGQLSEGLEVDMDSIALTDERPPRKSLGGWWYLSIAVAMTLVFLVLSTLLKLPDSAVGIELDVEQSTVFRTSVLQWREGAFIDVPEPAAANHFKPIHPKRDYEFILVPLKVSNTRGDTKTLRWKDFRLEGDVTWVSALSVFTTVAQDDSPSTLWINEADLDVELVVGDSFSVGAVFEAPVDFPGRALRMRPADPEGLKLEMAEMKRYDFLRRPKPATLPPRTLEPAAGHEFLVIGLTLRNSARSTRDLVSFSFELRADSNSHWPLQVNLVQDEKRNDDGVFRIESAPLGMRLAGGEVGHLPVFFEVPKGAAVTLQIRPSFDVGSFERFLFKLLDPDAFPTLEIAPE